MKKFALALMAAAAAVLGLGIVADAYPPGLGVVTATPASGAPGYTVTVKASCQPGETVTVVLVAESGTDTCGAAGTAALALVGFTKAGGATVALKTPTTPGTYNGRVTGSTTGDLLGFSITVIAPPPTDPKPGGELPDTGSSGVSTMTLIALGLFAVGAGLFGVAQLRRRQAAGL